MNGSTDGGSRAPRLIAMEVAGFRGWRDAAELDLTAPLTLLVGENAAGKSSTLNAIEWCLFGVEITKKSSGIDERADWDVVAREGAREARVVLRFRTVEGETRIERRRSRSAKVRESDWFQVVLPSGAVLDGEEEVQSWFAHMDLPDWDEWKHAFCQHQELSRARVLDAADRSAQLGKLLGLEQYQVWTERWKTLRIADLEKAAQAADDDLERALNSTSSKPRLEADRLEQQLETYGIERMALSAGLLPVKLREVVAQGTRMLQLARLPVEPVDADDVRAVIRWAQSLPVKCNEARGALTRQLSADEGRASAWGLALISQDPTEKTWRDTRDKRAAFESKHGSVERMQSELDALGQDRAALDQAERRENALLSLLRQAAEQPGVDSACPVCEQSASGLNARLRQRVATLTSESAAERDRQRRSITGRETELRKVLNDAIDLERALKGAEAARNQSRVEVAKHVPAGVEGTAAAAQLDQFRREIERRRAELAEFDQGVGDLRRATDCVDLLMRWITENDRAQAVRGDLRDLDSWKALQAALDEAAGLARDIEVLADLTREAQESRSSERVRVVNESLGAHYANITGAREQDCARVQVKRTAAKLAYAFVDGEGHDVLPTLNQAALNALSLAILFAQAEGRARDGRPAWLMLDDPIQSLDASARSGLAKALKELSTTLPVIVATFTGSLTEELSASDSVRTYRLTVGARGPQIEEDRR